MSKVGVSILCLAYNHEEFIARTIEGFLMQQTDFPIEIIIHEDASTDGTAAVIREYEQKHPDVIKPIYQTENQFQKGVNINAEFMLPLATGKYVALCDGDDYWTDPHKLQKQYDAMEQHPECEMCLHKVKDVLEQGDKTIVKYIPKVEIPTGILSSEEFMRHISKSNIFNEVCYFFRRDSYSEYQYNYPVFAQESMKARVDDAPMLLYFGQLAKVCYINEDMATYRRQVPGSWSDNLKKAEFEHTKRYCESAIARFKEFNKFTNDKYAEILEPKIRYFEFKLAEAYGDYKTMVKKEYRGVLAGQKRSYRIRIRLMAACRPVFGALFGIFDKLKGR